MVKQKTFNKHGKPSILWQEMISAILIFIIGFFVVRRSFMVFPKEEITIGSFNFIEAGFYFLIATLVILFLVSFVKSRKIFQIFFALVLFSGLQVVFSVFASSETAALIALALIIFKYIIPYIWYHNILMIGALGGIGAVFGLSLEPKVAVLIVVVLAVYDIAAVFYTKHMVKMARGLADKGVFLAIIIPEKIKMLNRRLDEFKPGGPMVILGGGDLALPLVLASSAAIYGFYNYFLVALFSLLGFAAVYFIFESQKIRRPIPALPPIAAAGIVGFLISLLIF